MGLLSDAPSHAALLEEAAGLGSTHLRQLLQKEDRPLQASFGGVVLDYSRQKITPDTLAKLEALGGNFMCSSNRETVMYHAMVFQEDVATALQLLSEVVLEPTFTDEEVSVQPLLCFLAAHKRSA